MKIAIDTIAERAKPLIERIVQYHTRKGNEKPEISEIFASEPGKLFGSQADQLLEFGMRGQIVTIFPGLLKYIKRAAKTITSDEYTRFVESEVDEEELIRWQNIQSFMR